MSWGYLLITNIDTGILSRCERGVHNMSKNRNLAGFHFFCADDRYGVVQAAQGDFLLVQFFDEAAYEQLGFHPKDLQLVAVDEAAEQRWKFVGD